MVGHPTLAGLTGCVDIGSRMVGSVEAVPCPASSGGSRKGHLDKMSRSFGIACCMRSVWYGALAISRSSVLMRDRAYGTDISRTGFASPSCWSRSIICQTPVWVPYLSAGSFCPRCKAHRYANDLAGVDDRCRGEIVIFMQRPFLLHIVHLVQDQLHRPSPLRRAVARFGPAREPAVSFFNVERRRREGVELASGQNGRDVFPRSEVA